MERHRTIHDKNRINSYRIDISKVTEDVRVIIDDEEGNIFFDKVIPFNHIKGVKSLHFKFVSNKVEWDKPSSIIVEA